MERALPRVRARLLPERDAQHRDVQHLLPRHAGARAARPRRAATPRRDAASPRRRRRHVPRLTASPRRPLSQVLFKHFYPQERKSQQSLFWFGLGADVATALCLWAFAYERR